LKTAPLAELRRSRRERERVSLAQGDQLNFAGLCARYRLSEHERTVVSVLFFHGASPRFRQRLEEAGLELD
jgi:hypothetical protein